MLVFERFAEMAPPNTQLIECSQLTHFFCFPLDDTGLSILCAQVVFVLFAAIILLLVSTNCRRLQTPLDEPRSPEAQQTIVRFKEKSAIVATETLPRDLV